MRFFWVLDYQHEVLAVFLGIVTAVLIYLGFRSYSFTKERADERSEEKFDYPDKIHGVNHPVPPFLLFIILGFVVWFFFYIIIFGFRGGPIY